MLPGGALTRPATQALSWGGVWERDGGGQGHQRPNLYSFLARL